MDDRRRHHRLSSIVYRPASEDTMHPHQVAQERIRYIDLCMRSRGQGRLALETELAQIGRELDGLRDTISTTVRSLQGQPGHWLQRWLRPRALEQQAAAEFDTLAALPGVAAIDCDRAARRLRVTIAS